MATGIVDTAAQVLAERRDASMAEIATAAGVGRATLYRYFPNREALLRVLAGAGIDELGRRIVEAGLDALPVREGIARLSRAIVTTGRKYIALVELPPGLVDARAVETQIVEPIRALLARGVADGTLRDDFDPETLRATFLGILRSLIKLSIRGGQGVEQVSAAATTAFLDGAARTQL
ncbi:DNA-binding transcriptional regulator, AcrR family [Saccharopolyspora antimicrobica]|uniref:DNA-binding transcriptional regulator, AcrR family n=1 Tax=Saccharopolyspora antimicrobica TaxID=455193 RepID=A0A1I4VPV8_9PSEU|nr:TetR family transcriptional regulator [Saccharopolyspora antimicrobica]SFN03087.1 DNA-binding transcriptional regulator, AcrR family [Saccharopolyspora antimicrobica]